MRSALPVAFAVAMATSASLASLPASANPDPQPAPRQTTSAGRMATDDCARARKAGKTCELTLPPEDVGGQAVGPDDIALRLLRFGQAGSLIRVRRDFIPEIVKAAEDL